MKALLNLASLLFLAFALNAQQLEVDGKMLVKDINTIATFQSSVKNSFIKIATNDDLLRSTNLGYFDDGTDKYFFIDAPGGDFGEFIILGDGRVGIGLPIANANPGAQLGVIGANTRAIYASSLTHVGVWGTSHDSHGIFGQSILNAGVDGYSVNSYGVSATGGGDNPVDFWAAHNSYGGTSSRRWKRNIENITNPLDKLTKLRGVYFDWDEGHGGKHGVGFIAEEVGEVFPEVVFYEANGVDAKGMDYSKMTSLLVEAANAMRLEYQDKLDNQQDQINELEDRISEMSVLKKEMSELRILIKTEIDQ